LVQFGHGIWALAANQCNCFPPQKGQIQGTQGETNVPILLFLKNYTFILETTMHSKHHPIAK